MIRFTFVLIGVALTLSLGLLIGCDSKTSPQSPKPKGIKFILQEEPNNTVILTADPKTDWEIGSDSDAIMACLNELLLKKGDLVIKKVVPVETTTLILARTRGGEVAADKKIVTKAIVYFDKKQYVEEPIMPKVR